MIVCEDEIMGPGYFWGTLEHEMDATFNFQKPSSIKFKRCSRGI
jgi:hypothetical protein